MLQHHCQIGKLCGVCMLGWASPNSRHICVFASVTIQAMKSVSLLVTVSCLWRPTSLPCPVGFLQLDGPLHLWCPPVSGVTAQAPLTLLMHLQTATLVMVANYTDCKSTIASGMQSKLCWRWELKTSLSRSSARQSNRPPLYAWVCWVYPASFPITRVTHHQVVIRWLTALLSLPECPALKAADQLIQQ